MFQVFLENEFMQILVDEENSVLSDAWKPESRNMHSTEDVKQGLQMLYEAGKDKHYRLLFTDTRFLYYPVPPDVQAWAFENVVQPLIARGLQKQAFVMPSDVFAVVSVEQYSEDAMQQTHAFQIRHFDDADVAMQWLFS